MQVFSAVQGHCTVAFYDAITGPPEFIISIVNSVKMVNTLSGSMGKLVASHAEGCNVARSNPGCG